MRLAALLAALLAAPAAAQVSVGERRALREQVRDMLQELLIRGRAIEPAPPLWKRTWFWVATSAATAVVATTAALWLSDPDITTEVRFAQPR